MAGTGVANTDDRRERYPKKVRSRNRWVVAILALAALGFYVGFVLLHVLK